MKKAILSIILIFLLVEAYAQQIPNVVNNGNAEKGTVAAAPVITSRIVFSSQVNDEFKLNISFPENYDPNREKKYPVIYQLDGKFLLVHTIVAEYFLEEMIPEVILIGIAYPATNQRDRDYTYGFSYFYRFLEQELIPLIEREYHADPNCRILTGYSYGGLCCLQAIFEYTNPDKIIFQHIIAGSPSIWWPDGGGFVFSLEENLYYQTKKLPINLFMSIGSLESVVLFNNFIKILWQRNYQNFNYSYKIDYGYGHDNEHKELNFRDGIKWLFSQDLNRTNVIKTEKANAEYKIFPNPSTGRFAISSVSGGAKNIKIDLFSINGQPIYTKQISNSNSADIDLSGHPKGIYFAKITNGTKVFTEKIVVK